MSSGKPLVIAALLLAPFVVASRASAQATPEQPTAASAAAIEQAQAQKALTLHPFQPGKVEEVLDNVEKLLVSGSLHVHPFFESAYAGGGFTLGAGYARYLSAYNVLDLRGSITLSGYKRIEAAVLMPRVLDRRGSVTLLGGWREATQVGFYGVGLTNTSVDQRANYGFAQPYGSATLDLWPTRKLLLVRTGAEISQWKQEAGGGSAPSVEEVYTPQTLVG